MSDETISPENSVAPDCRSSIFDKTTPELRRKLDRAILNYDPAGYLAIFKKYDLPAHGVSYTAFYCYARKLRSRDSVRQLFDPTAPEDDGLVEALPRLIAQFLVEQIMANDQAGADTIYRLTLAHRAALENAALARKHRRIAAAVPSEPLPQGRRVAVETSAEWPSNSNDSTPSRATRANEAPNPVNLVHLSDAELLQCADRLIAQEKVRCAEEKARANEERAQVLDRVKRAQEELRAAGDHEAADKLAADIAVIMADDFAPIAVDPVPPVPVVPAVPSPPPIPHSIPSNLCSSASSAEKTSDAIVSTADDELRITPEERRRREFLRIALAYGLIKPEAAIADSS
jgi:hypothetical protein